MSELTGNLRGVLNCVETLVKNIRRRRDLIVEAIDGKQCVSTKQLSNLLTTFVDQILDDSDKTSEENLCKTLSEEPHKELTTDVNAHKLIENELRQQIRSLEDSLKKETEDKQRIQKHCSKIMENCLKKDDKHKSQIQTLNETIENLKKSESELKTRITEFENKPKSDPITEIMKCEVKKEILVRTSFKKEEPPVKSNLNGFHKESEEDMEEDEELESDPEEDQTLRKQCLASRLSITLERVDSPLDKQNETIVEEVVDYTSDVESIIDLTDNTDRIDYKSKVFEANLTDMPYIVKGKGFRTTYHCTMEKCGFICRTADIIIEHIHSCQGIEVEKFECSKCSRLFLSKRGMEVHMGTKHGKRVYPRKATSLGPQVKDSKERNGYRLRHLKRLRYV